MTIYTNPSFLRRLAGTRHLAVLASVGAIGLAITIGAGSAKIFDSGETTSPAQPRRDASAVAPSVAPATKVGPVQLLLVPSAADASFVRELLKASGVSVPEVVVADSPQDARGIIDDQAAMNRLRAAAGVAPVEVVALGMGDAGLGVHGPDSGVLPASGADVAGQLQAVTDDQLRSTTGWGIRQGSGADVARQLQAVTDDQLRR